MAVKEINSSGTGAHQHIPGFISVKEKTGYARRSLPGSIAAPNSGSRQPKNDLTTGLIHYNSCEDFLKMVIQVKYCPHPVFMFKASKSFYKDIKNQGKISMQLRFANPFSFLSSKFMFWYAQNHLPASQTLGGEGKIPLVWCVISNK